MRTPDPRGPALELALQTTLLGLAIAIILALLAALVGPLLIDWGGYRSVFEAEASHLIGVNVRFTGSIDAKLLPSPSLTLHDIKIGKGDSRIDAKSLGIEFALGPLMRGQWHAAELRLTGAQLQLGLDPAGKVQAPNMSIGFSPDALSIGRLSIENAAITLTDAENGARLVLEKFWFHGKARSLLGPFDGEGATTIAGAVYPFRVSTGRVDSEGTVKLHVNVDPVARPLSIAAEGSLAIVGGKPSFDGSLNLARPVGITSPRAASVTQPWRIGGKIKVTAASTLMPDLEFHYGSEDQAVKLTGTAEFKFGKHPRFNAVLSGRQIDLDRAIAGEAVQSPPAAAMRKLAALAAVAFRPTFPIQIGIGIDRVKLGGSAIDNVRGDISTDAGGWDLDRLEFRAPGLARVRLSGQLAVGAKGVAFTGPAEIDTDDPRAFAAWIDGRPAPKQSELRPLRLRGDVTLSAEKLAIEHLNAEFDQQPIAGRLVYAAAGAGHAAKLEAKLTAAELDVDAALGFGKALLAGTNLARPQEVVIAADIGRATSAGIDMRGVSVRVKVDGNGLRIDRLSAADLGGGAFSASGRIDTGGHAPRGALVIDFETRQAAAAAALAAKFVPPSMSPIAATLDHVAHTKLHATLDVAGDKTADATVAKISVAGALDTMHFDAGARISGDWAKPSAADVEVDATVNAADGGALLKLIGLGQIAGAGHGPGELKLQLAGAADDKLRGTLRVSGSALQVNSRVSIASGKVAFDDIDARAEAAVIRGHLAIGAGSPRRVDGALEANMVDAAGLIARLAGMPAAAVSGTADGWRWSNEPFAGGAMGDFAGEISLKAQRVYVTPQLAMRDFQAALHLSKDAVAFDDMAADFAGGRLSGQLALRAADLGLSAHGKLTLSGADVASLLPAAARPPVTGAIDLAVEIDGTAASPAGLIGSLHGSGQVALNDGELAGLDPRTFDIVNRAAANATAPGVTQLSAVVGRALESGRFSFKHAQGTFSISAGQVRLGNLTIHSDKADLALSGNLDMTDGIFDARLVLSGAAQASDTRPDIYFALHGPIATPKRSLDVSALAGWLALRAIENESSRLKPVEGAAPSPTPGGEAKPPPHELKPKIELKLERKTKSEITPKTEQAPALPAPVIIKSVPLPRPALRPQASVNPHQ